MSSGSYLGRGDIDLNVAFLMSSDAQRRGRRKHPASPGNWISIVSARTVNAFEAALNLKSSRPEP